MKKLKGNSGLNEKQQLLSSLIKRLGVRFMNNFFKANVLLKTRIKTQILFFREFSFSGESIRNHLTNKAVAFFGFQEMKKKWGHSKPTRRHFRFKEKNEFSRPNSVNGLAERFHFKKSTKNMRQNFYEPAK